MTTNDDVTRSIHEAFQATREREFIRAQRQYDAQEPPWVDAPTGTTTLPFMEIELEDLECDVDDGEVTLLAVWIGKVKITDRAILGAIQAQYQDRLDDEAQERLLS